ncbi:caspase family protein [Bradyrhizobium barranii subsp. barranii]|uniref:Caspase family protein n=1 Tax=Bradyrhizobium barranii subsp. barranii TaxID=2823807 RepID=A0A7Z0TQF6_9BRAD|nr:caspase family protein [Bradyrhizobium barranii]UGX93643.1 caspase family protein [Bradyrhizobium barranii subsp. barranii]
MSDLADVNRRLVAVFAADVESYIRFCRQELRLALLLVALFPAPASSAQDTRPIEILTQVPHSRGISSAAFSRDGTRLLSGSEDDTLKLWDAATGRLIRTFVGHANDVTSVAFSPDGAQLLSGSEDRTLKLWDAATGHLIRSFEGHSLKVRSVTFSPDGTQLLSGSNDSTVRLWEAASGRLMRTFKGHHGAVNAVAFSPDGTLLLSGGEGGSTALVLWDARTGQPIRTFDGVEVSSVAFSSDGTQFVSAHFWSATLKLWDTSTGRLIRSFVSDYTKGEVDAVAFSPDGKRLLSGGLDHSLHVWDVETGQRTLSLNGHTYAVNSVAFSPDGAQLLSGSEDRTLKLWDAKTGRLIRTLGTDSGGVESIALSFDGMLLLSGNGDKTIRLWDLTTGQLNKLFVGHNGSVHSVAFSLDATRVLSGSGDDYSFRMWDALSGRLIKIIQQEEGERVYSVAFSPDGKQLLSGASHSVSLWDAASGRLTRKLRSSQPLFSVKFSPDGALIAAGGEGPIKLWDAKTGNLIRTLGEGLAYPLAFSPDGEQLLSAYLPPVKLWNVSTGTLVRTFVHSARNEVVFPSAKSDDVLSVAFSPDGRRVLSSGVDTTVKVWESGTGELLQTLGGHFDFVNAVTFSRDGKRIISGSEDATIRIWDAQSGALLVTLVGGADGSWLAITPAGFFVASRGRGDGLLSVVRGLEVTTVGQVHQSLFNPDLVRETLAGDPTGEVRVAAEVINLDKVLDSGPAPLVEITSHPPVSSSNSDLVTVSARIRDRGKGVGRIEWRINGVTVGVENAPARAGPVYEVKRELGLDQGDNVIEVVAYNGRNLLASLPAQISIAYTGLSDKVKPKLFVLAIGINKYVDKGGVAAGETEATFFPPLAASVPDAEAFSAEMAKAGSGLYAKVHVIKALDGDATVAKLEETFKKLASEISPRDTFVFYAAAHGYSLAGNYYMIPQDYQGGLGPEAIKTRAIGQDRIQDWIANRIKAKKAIILLDTCESGALTGGYTKSRTEGPLSEAAVGRLHEATGRSVLTAASSGKSAYEGYKGHGVFTYALMEALHKGDTNHNGKIELTELAAYVERRVPELFAELKSNGWVVKGGTAVAVRGIGDDAQSAHFGSTGGDFALVNNLQ